MGGWTGGWLVPNNDIGYLICNRRQYRLATPHFIPRLTSLPPPPPCFHAILYTCTDTLYASLVYTRVCIYTRIYEPVQPKQGYRCKYTFALPQVALFLPFPYIYMNIFTRLICAFNYLEKICLFILLSITCIHIFIFFVNCREIVMQKEGEEMNDSFLFSTR